ncbi:hypothetical protein GLOTRDRAFT_133234 [Gloeophyllum trabeum ATCC 11539]|uniref:Uncharacterized protein n=1 Tax=Gloeophyllum trabeum (strain ATCC 11539 / FP-39264 / Madison 617) TaxID=670483 RepID=S7RFS8_GLOTA|nr:uncharacterized protein GLOTRDRAFT_133234 [Gloeophyllum trabeum ATCC 11539]EPQ51369.1 hypothetical protein GLOTRDRAFT_133234 [Gloeophyllum trabeum ATCC 11539]
MDRAVRSCKFRESECAYRTGLRPAEAAGKCFPLSKVVTWPSPLEQEEEENEDEDKEKDQSNEKEADEGDSQSVLSPEDFANQQQCPLGCGYTFHFSSYGRLLETEAIYSIAVERLTGCGPTICLESDPTKDETVGLAPSAKRRRTGAIPFARNANNIHTRPPTAEGKSKEVRKRIWMADPDATDIKPKSVTSDMPQMQSKDNAG